MNSLEILKQAGQITSDLIKAKTPPVFETCRSAYADLGDLVAYSKAAPDDDGVSEDFAEGLRSVIARLETFCSGYASNPTVEKKMEAPELAVYVKEQIEKALAEETTPALRRLHALKNAIAKATSYYSNETATIATYTDPFQQATVEVSEEGRKVTSGSAQVSEVAGTPSLSVTDVWKSVVEAVAKAEQESKDLDTGWSRDLASPEFLEGKRYVDFGRDGVK